MERLRSRFLNVEVDAVLHPASDSAQRAANEQKDKATIALGNSARQRGSPEIGHAESEERRRVGAAETVRAEESGRLAEAESAPWARRLIQWGSGVLLLLAIGGGAYWYQSRDPLQQALDSRWPPITADPLRQAAISSAASALKGLVAPNLAAGVDVATIQGIALEEVKSKGVTKLTLATDRQLLRMTADFDLTLTTDDLPQESDMRSLIASLAPRVAGEVEFFLTAAASVSAPPQRALRVKLLPAVYRVRIDKLTVKGSYDVAVAADAIKLVLDRYAGDLSGALSAIPFMNVTLPATLQDGFVPSGPIKVDLDEAPGLNSLSASSASSPKSSQSGLLSSALSPTPRKC
jgi:hypothetical protein